MSKKPRSFAPVSNSCKTNLDRLCLTVKVKKKKEKDATANVFVSSKFTWHLYLNRAESSITLNKSEIIREEFKPFVFVGLVSLDSCSG